MSEISDSIGQTDGLEASVAEDGLGDHPLLIAGVMVGYLVAVVTSAVASWAVPQWLGYQLDWTREATGLFAAEGYLVHSAFRLAFASFPIVFAVCVVVIDLLVVGVLTEQSRSNWLGLVGWSGLSATVLALSLFPTATVLSPYGVVGLMMAPGVGVLTVGLVVVAAAAAGVVGLSIPHALFDGLSLRAASRQTAVILVDDPTVVIPPLRSLSVGWVVGMGSFLIGVVVLGLAIGIFVIGLILLPAVLLLWVGAAVGFAAGHVAYRLRTRVVYRGCRQ